jgi:hydrogenase-4 component F
MMTIYIIASLILAGAFLLIKNIFLRKVLIILSLIDQSAFTYYAFLHLGEADTPFFAYDSLGVLLTAVLTILSFATFYHSLIYFKEHKTISRHQRIYLASLGLLISAMTATYFSSTMGVMWASIEATTLAVAVLIYHERTKVSIEATWKYIFISSIGIALAFIGIMFLSAVAADNGLSNLDIDGLVGVAKQMDPTWLKISFVLILTGFSAKMGLFPLHTVCIDAHTVAPPPISAFISTSLMNVGFVGIYRMYTIVAQTEILAWSNSVLLIIGVLSILFSATQLIRVKHFKRMIAFSSLEHMGIVAICLSAGGIGHYAAILHIVLHSFIKSALFYQIAQVKTVFGTYSISHTGNYIKKNPIGALIILFGFIVIVGIPPSGLFYTELLMIKSMLLGGQTYIVILILILLTIILFALGKNFLQLLYGNAKEDISDDQIPISRWHYVSQFVLLGLIVYLGFNPPDLLVGFINSAIEIIQ